MYTDTCFRDEVIITASGGQYQEVTGKTAVVMDSSRDADGIWYSAYVAGRVWRVKAADTVPTGRRVPAAQTA